MAFVGTREATWPWLALAGARTFVRVGGPTDGARVYPRLPGYASEDWPVWLVGFPMHKLTLTAGP